MSLRVRAEGVRMGVEVVCVSVVDEGFKVSMSVMGIVDNGSRGDRVHAC
jgi:hypothetical protein